MVTPYKGWKASDDTLHSNYATAARHEADLQLKKLDILNEATRKAVLDKAHQIVEALTPIVAGEPAQTAERS